MEQPTHDLRAHSAVTAAQATPGRIIAAAAAILLQVGLIYALAAGLAAQLLEKLPEELKAEVVQEKIPDKTPPPPPPELQKPPPPFVPPPEINIQAETTNTNAITTQSKVETPKPVPQISSPASIGRPHSCLQDYPTISQRLNEEGTTMLGFKITPDGSVTDVHVATSSGHDRLDQAAVQCAQSWRYKPAMQNGQPVEVPWQTAVQWKLK
jgi:protein TonB